MLDTRLLPMAVRDLDQVVEIENKSHLAPWTLGKFTDSLDAGYWAYSLTQLGIDDAPDTLIAYCILMPGVDDLSLLNITVDPQYRRQSWARKIMAVMEDQAIQKNFQKIFLEVRAGNAPAIALYERMGYQRVGIRKAYYPIHEGQREDALVMMKELMKESIRA